MAMRYEKMSRRGAPVSQPQSGVGGAGMPMMDGPAEEAAEPVDNSVEESTERYDEIEKFIQSLSDDDFNWLKTRVDQLQAERDQTQPEEPAAEELDNENTKTNPISK